jgi:hypothetical protein
LARALPTSAAQALVALRLSVPCLCLACALAARLLPLSLFGKLWPDLGPHLYSDLHTYLLTLPSIYFYPLLHSLSPT